MRIGDGASPDGARCLDHAPADRRSAADFRWLHRYACFLSVATLFLIVAGGMVTSTGSGLAVPDWPTTYGENMFTYPPSKWVGGIFYEHGHRLIASTVGMLTIGLAVWLQVVESRRWLRRLGWIALAAVILQGLLGGLTVLLKLPTAVSVFHACLAQAFFCIVVSIAVLTSPAWAMRSRISVSTNSPVLRYLSLLSVAVVFIQLLLGALMRHTGSGLAVPDFPLAYGQVVPDLDPVAIETYNTQRAFDFLLPEVTAGQILIHMLHRLGAVLVTAAIIAACAAVIRRHRDLRGLRRPAIVALVLLVCQLGLGAATVWLGRPPLAATAHVAVGAATLGCCWMMTLNAYGFLRLTETPAADLSPVASGAIA